MSAGPWSSSHIWILNAHKSSNWPPGGSEVRRPILRLVGESASGAQNQDLRVQCDQRGWVPEQWIQAHPGRAGTIRIRVSTEKCILVAWLTSLATVVGYVANTIFPYRIIIRTRHQSGMWFTEKNCINLLWARVWLTQINLPGRVWLRVTNKTDRLHLMQSNNKYTETSN